MVLYLIFLQAEAADAENTSEKPKEVETDEMALQRREKQVQSLFSNLHSLEFFDLLIRCKSSSWIGILWWP